MGVNVKVPPGRNPDSLTSPFTPRIDPRTLPLGLVIGSNPVLNMMVTGPDAGIDPPTTVTYAGTPPWRTPICVEVWPPMPPFTTFTPTLACRMAGYAPRSVIPSFPEVIESPQHTIPSGVGGTPCVDN